MLGRRRNKNLKLLSNDERSGPKPILELLKERLFNDSTSLWFGADLIYHASVTRRSDTGSSQSRSDASKLLAEMTNSGSERYLAVIRKKDVLASVHVVQIVVRKETGVEFKQVWEFKTLKAVEYGQDDNELLLTFNAADHSFFFSSPAEKDEAAWVFIKVCKIINGYECSIGYTIDLDAISYALSQSGSLTRHPLLKQLGIGGHSGDVFAEEEAEAEALLEERNWTSHDGAPMDLEVQLGKESDALQMEIIDFLLQWEEDEGSDAQAGGRDTLEIIESLNQVDEELGRVDVWLGQQIEQLVSIQGKLVLIEAESSSLETSWQNLSTVQRMLDTLSRGLTLAREHEEVLAKPDKLFARAVASADLVDVDSILAPLNEAISSLRLCLSLKGESSETSVLTQQHWRQLQIMSAISTQRGKLLDLSDKCCSVLTDMLAALFDKLLLHKALNEAGSRRPSVVVQKFSFGPAIRANVGTPEGQRNYGVVQSSNNNQAMASQRTFHDALTDFLPTLEHVLELSPQAAVPICNAYVQAAHDKLYRPLVKTMFRDLQAILLPRHAVVTLASLPRVNSLVSTKSQEASMKFFRYSINLQNALLHPWEAFEVALCHLCPLVRREEAFFSAVFQLDATGMGNPPPVMPDVQLAAQFSSTHAVPDTPIIKSKAETMLDNLFGYVLERVEKLANPASETDGVEAVAMLAVLQRFMSEHLGLAIGPAPPPAAGDAATPVDPLAALGSDGPKFGSECSPYLAVLMYALRASLVKRLYAYLGEQAAWIAHQRADPKKSSVLPPVAKFPSLVLQVVECMGGQYMECVNQVFFKLAKDLFKWIAQVASSNEKYAEVVKMHNFGFFEEAIGPLNIPFLEKFVAYAGQQRKEAEARYVRWMISYEFPELSALAARMEGVGARVKPEELALYVRRKDVLHVIQLLDAKKVEAGVASMRSRLEKHCDASEPQVRACAAVSSPRSSPLSEPFTSTPYPTPNAHTLSRFSLALAGSPPALQDVDHPGRPSRGHPAAPRSGRLCKLPDHARADAAGCTGDVRKAREVGEKRGDR